MGPIAARHARAVLEHVERIVAIELIAGVEALDQRLAQLPAGAAPGAGVAEARRRIRAHVAPLTGDREPGPDLAAVTRLVHDGALVDLAGGASR